MQYHELKEEVRMVEKSGGLHSFYVLFRSCFKVFKILGLKGQLGVRRGSGKYLAGIVHGMCCNDVEKLWK